MRWETAEPPGAGDPPRSDLARRQGAEEPPGEEHLGPISFAREVKGDGRLLILFRRASERHDG